MPPLPISDMKGLKRKPQALPPNAMLEQTEPTHWRLFYPMGEPLLVQTNDTGLLEAASDAFGKYGQPSQGHDCLQRKTANPLVLTLFVHDVGPEPAVWQSDGQPRPIYRTHGNLFFITFGAHNTAVADLVLGRALAFFSPEMVGERALVRYIFIEGLVFAMLGPARKMITCHAACVVKEGSGIILYGQAGRGKSTLAYACAKSGFQFLSEDAVFLSGGPGPPRLWGVPWKLHLLPDSKYLFPELGDEKPKLQINGEWKLELEMEQLVPGSTTTNASPGLVLFLEREPDTGPTRVEPLSPEQALAGFDIIWPWWVGWTDEMEQRIPMLWERGAYRLWMNGSPSEAVRVIDTLSQ